MSSHEALRLFKNNICDPKGIYTDLKVSKIFLFSSVGLKDVVNGLGTSFAYLSDGNYIPFNEPSCILIKLFFLEWAISLLKDTYVSGIGDVTDTTTWQTLGGGVADYLSALPLPLHHLLKYSTPASNITEGKKEEQPTIVTAVNANVLPSMSNIATVSL